MSQIVQRSTTDLSVAPLAEILPGSAEALFGCVVAPSALQVQVAERHRSVMRAMPQTTDITFVGVRQPLKGIVAEYDEAKGLNWALMPIEVHAADGLQMPHQVQSAYERAYRSNAFEGFYIAHAWRPEQTSLQRPLRGSVTLEQIREPLESPAIRSVRQFFDGSERGHQTLMRGFNRAVVAMGDAVIRALGWGISVSAKLVGLLVIGLIALIGVAIAAIIATATAAIAVAISVAVAAVAVPIVVIASIGGLFLAGVDPILYGFVTVSGSDGRPYKMLYKLAQWDNY